MSRRIMSSNIVIFSKKTPYKILLYKTFCQSIALGSLALAISGCNSTSALKSSPTTPSITKTDIDQSTAAQHQNAVQAVSTDNAIATSEGINQVVTANNQFAITMYQQLNAQANQQSKNVFFSPYSLSSAMAMLYNAAKGETKQQIQQTFYYPELAILNPNSAALYQKLNKANPSYQFVSTNDLWIAQDLKPNQNYLDTVAIYYGNGVRSLDFKNSPEAVRLQINKTIADYTQQMIPTLMLPGSVSADTATVLTNAVYFKGDWQTPFNPSEKKPFHLFDGSTVNIDMMDKKANFAYVENEQTQVVKLPYKGEALSMLVILPKAKDQAALQNLVSRLSTEQIKQWTDSLVKREVMLNLPKFKLQQSYEMAPLLSNIGMPLAFGSQADFGLFSEQIAMKVNAVVHQAVVEVDETGTKAAAAAGISIMPMSLGYSTGRIEFTADHPFIFMIMDNESDAILFLGQVNKP